MVIPGPNLDDVAGKHAGTFPLLIAHDWLPLVMAIRIGDLLTHPMGAGGGAALPTRGL